MKRKELIETRNSADSLVYGVEKNIKEFGDKVDAAEKNKIDEAISTVKKSLEGDDIEAIKKAQEELMNLSHKLAEAMYAKTAGPQGGQGGPGGPDAGAGHGGAEQASGKKDDDVVDADFEEVKK